jgi:hypothetical protein
MQGNGTVAGANTQIQYNADGMNFGGNAGFTFEAPSGNVNIPGNLIVVGNISGTINSANFANYAGNVTVSSQPNITSLGTLIALEVGGNANITGNANVIGNINVTGNTNISNLANVGNLQVNSTNVSIGSQSGINQGVGAIAVGALAGYADGGTKPQRERAIAIGGGAGMDYQGNFAIAIGYLTASNSQSDSAIAVGASAGAFNQGNNSIAIGERAGQQDQGDFSIAIGDSAGNTNQANNSIILNATGAILNQTTANSFTVKPIRQSNATYALFYNTSSGEITYDTAANIANSNYAFFAGNVVNSSQPNITSVGTLTGLVVNGNISANSNITANGNISTSGNITARQITSNVATGTAPFVVTSTTQVANLNVATAGTANSVAGANVTGTVANATYAASAGSVVWNNNIPIGISASAGNTFGIAIGSNAKSAANGISIGQSAGRDPLGFNPGNNVIIINATGANLPYQGSDSTCFIAPMASSSYFGNGTQELMWYNTSTKEVRSSTNGLAGYNGNITANNISASNNITSNNYIKSKVFVSANIANPIGAGAGARSFVSDATSTTFGALYASGGANNVPVYSDGSAWRIG